MKLQTILKQNGRDGEKLLWNTANMFSHPRFNNGAASSNNAEVFAYAAAQVKKGLDISKNLVAKTMSSGADVKGTNL